MFGWILKTDWDIDRMMRWYASRHRKINMQEI